MSLPAKTSPDMLSIGAGITGATFGVLLKEFNSLFTVEILARPDAVA